MSKSQSTKPIKIGIAGIGRAGWGMHCNELDKRPELFRIVAACDLDPQRLERMQTRYQCRTYTAFRDLIKDPEVEMIAIATPSPIHTDQALLALKAGKLVVVEKPIALTLADAQRLARADKRYPGKIFLRHNRRFEAGFTHIREILAAGLLGEPFEFKLRRNSYSRRDDWQTIIACGGGQLNNWAPHIIDHALRFLDSPVADMWSDLKRVAAVGDAEDHLKIVLRGKNGRVVDLEISGGAALSEPECTVYGTRGALVCQDNQLTLKYLDPAVKLAPRHAIKETPPMEGSFGNPDHLTWRQETIPVSPKAACDTDHIWNHVYAAVRNKKPYPITVAQGVEVVRIADRARCGTPFAGRRRK